jgi:hypothetical protein
MTITFSIIKSRERLEKQWKNLAKRGFTKLYWLKKLSLILGIATVLYLALYFFTPKDDFEVLKELSAFLLLNGWIVLFLFSVFMYLRNIRNNLRLKKFFNTVSSYQLSYDVEINDECVKIISGQNVVELPWSQFIWYGVLNDTIYVYNEVKALDSLFWDRDEMGNDNYLQLIDLVKQKSIKQTF